MAAFFDFSSGIFCFLPKMSRFFFRFCNVVAGLWLKAARDEFGWNFSGVFLAAILSAVMINGVLGLLKKSVQILYKSQSRGELLHIWWLA